MNKKQVAAVLIVLAALVGAVAFYLTPSETPTTATTIPEEFNEVDDMFDELDDFLEFENQDFDFDLGDLENLE